MGLRYAVSVLYILTYRVLYDHDGFPSPQERVICTLYIRATHVRLAVLGDVGIFSSLLLVVVDGCDEGSK